MLKQIDYILLYRNLGVDNLNVCLNTIGRAVKNRTVDIRKMKEQLSKFDDYLIEILERDTVNKSSLPALGRYITNCYQYNVVKNRLLFKLYN